MGHPPGLHDPDPAGPLPAAFDVLEDHPGVHQRGNAGPIREIGVIGSETRVEGRDPLRFQVIDQAGQHSAHVDRAACLDQVCHGVDDDGPGPEVPDEPVHPDQVHLEAAEFRPRRVKRHEPFPGPSGQVEADGTHVPEDLALRFLEGEEEGTPAAAAQDVGKVGRQAGLPRPGPAGHEHAAAPVVPASGKHGVEPGDPRRDPFRQGFVAEPEGRDRQDREPLLVDEEGVLVGPVGRAAVLDHPQPPGGLLFGDPVIQQDDAVGHVLLEAVAGQALLPALGGDDGRHAPVLEPAEEAAKLGPEDGLVRQAREEGLHRVEDDAPRPHGLDGVSEPRKETLEVVLARLLDLASLDVYVIDGEFLPPCEGFDVEPEGGDVLRELFRRFLEGHENARLPVFDGTADEKFHAQQGFARAGAPDEQRRAPPRQPPRRDLVQPVDARRALADALPRRPLPPSERHLSPPLEIGRVHVISPPAFAAGLASRSHSGNRLSSTCFPPEII